MYMSQSFDHNLTVILDLDETLIFSKSPKLINERDHASSLRKGIIGVGSNLNPQGIFVTERPRLLEFLEEISKFCNIILFTASVEEYARLVIEFIDPKKRFFNEMYFRDSTTRVKNVYVKDLTKLSKHLNRIVIVDDNPFAFMFQPTNGIQVKRFRGDPEDDELMTYVLSMIKGCSKSLDVRLYITEKLLFRNPISILQ